MYFVVVVGVASACVPGCSLSLYSYRKQMSPFICLLVGYEEVGKHVQQASKVEARQGKGQGKQVHNQEDRHKMRRVKKIT